MNQSMTLSRQRLRTPRAAAIAGIIFSILLIIIVVLMRMSVPTSHEMLAHGFPVVQKQSILH